MVNKSIQRNHITLRRKNFLPTLFLIFALFITTFGIVYFSEPNGFTIFIFLIFIFSFLFFTFALIFANTRRGFVVALGVVLFLVLKMLGVGNILNLILLISLGIIVEVYANFKK